MSTIQSTAPLYSVTTDASGAVSTSSTATAAKTDTSADVANRFLTLLVSQLQNQDPLNPLDNAQVTSQLAQLSTVNGINKLNETMSALAASIGANQYLQAASLVGREVLTPGSSLMLADAKGGGGFTLPTSADKVSVTITDAAGQRIRQFDIGPLAAGTQRFDWDGKTDSGGTAKDGSYTFTVTQVAEGKTTELETLSVGKVTGIVPGSNGTQVQVAGVGLVDITGVKQIN
jgi:flagellar basal-body rod modification protein FlgD